MRTIDADKLVDMLYDNEFAVLCPLDEVSGVVDACPTVDAMPVVHGRWIPFHSKISGDIQYRSACEIGFVAKSDYCPHCGAKMDGERKDGGDG